METFMKLRSLLLGICLAIVITVPSPVHGQAQTFTPIHSFSGPTADGEYAFAADRIPMRAQ